MVKLVGKWFVYNESPLNFTPEYRHAVIKEILGKPYVKNGEKCQDVIVTVFNYRYVGGKTVPYGSETKLYCPTTPMCDLVGCYNIKWDTLRIASKTPLTLRPLAEGQRCATVTEYYSKWD